MHSVAFRAGTRRMAQPTIALIASVLLLDNPEELDKAYFSPNRLSTSV